MSQSDSGSEYKFQEGIINWVKQAQGQTKALAERYRCSNTIYHYRYKVVFIYYVTCILKQSKDISFSSVQLTGVLLL